MTSDQPRGFDDGEDMVENTYYDGTPDLSETMSDRNVSDGNIGMTDDTYYDGTPGVPTSVKAKRDKDANGRDNQYVYTYGHFTLEGREREKY